MKMFNFMQMREELTQKFCSNLPKKWRSSGTGSLVFTVHVVDGWISVEEKIFVGLYEIPFSAWPPGCQIQTKTVLFGKTSRESWERVQVAHLHKVC